MRDNKRTWQTRMMACGCVTGITLYAMNLRIDGATVPAVGASIVAGIAGYELGVDKVREITGTGGKSNQ